ncbi:ribbon-helix-helix domain-containing protein [Chroococcus sp. FPU101]|uniref:ribbon-helix-helix domain-containing protein n=1 Tax=Chroococcus sp. FPU101 TaxID=1974212 RepID=UPI001A90312C|nr:ribbon-helix-helix domain-containing protein [Chroococcus sp. FPU101]GFE70199.1 hypothetical protein CFPU101_28090 [Chroococcus sp. FPU101]
MKHSKTRTSLTLPTELLAAINQIVNQGKAKSRDEFVTKAIKNELAALKRSEIDAEFAQMAHDTEYQALAIQIKAEFAVFELGGFSVRGTRDKLD